MAQPLPDQGLVTNPSQRLAVSPRAIIIGLIGAAAAVFVVSWAELVVSSIQIAICQFAPAAIGLLFIIVIANIILRSLFRRLGLHAHEIIVIYVMILVASLTTSRGLLERWLPTLVAVNYYTTESNHWDKVFYGNIPQWAVIFDVRGEGVQRPAIQFYEGLRPGRSIPWELWAKPVGMWLIVIIAFFVAYACMAAIFRRQWVDNEKLTFPLVYLPLEMAKDESGAGAFFSNRLTWIGFAIPTFIFTLNGLHEIYPAVPMLKLQYPWNPFFNTLGRPWKDLGQQTVYCSMAAVGFSYFIPAQVLFALWSMYLFNRVENIMFSMFGKSFEAMPLYPTSLWNGYHVMGAYMVLAVYLVKSAWPHLRQVWERTKQPCDPAKNEPREFLSYRAAIIGLAVSSIVAIWWMTALGMSAWMATLEVIVFLFVVVLVMARSVSEAGMLMTETSFRPVDVVRIFTTQASLGGPTLTALAMVDAVFTRDLRGNLLSTMLDGLKMSDVVKLDRRHLFWSIMGSLALTLVWGTVLHLLIPYRRGAVTLYGYAYKWNSFAGFTQFAPVLNAADKFDPRLGVFFGTGVGFATFLAGMRTQHTWWPFSPLAFALSGSWSMIVFWFPILVAWLVKTTVLRYGGMKVYAHLRPFFLGLILGEFSQAVIWAALAAIWRLRAPFFPWP
ncbi:MAG: DUF6785 family protein [Armatimonadia bacterium]